MDDRNGDLAVARASAIVLSQSHHGLDRTRYPGRAFSVPVEPSDQRFSASRPTNVTSPLAAIQSRARNSPTSPPGSVGLASSPSATQYVGPRLNPPAARVKGAERTPLLVAGNIKRMRTSDAQPPCSRFSFQAPCPCRVVSFGLAEPVADPPPRQIGDVPQALTTRLDLPGNLVQIDALYGTLDRPTQFGRDRTNLLLKTFVISSAHHKIIAPAWRGRIVGFDRRPEEGVMESVGLLDRAGRSRCQATLSGFHQGRVPRNKGSCRRRHEPFYAHFVGMPTSGLQLGRSLWLVVGRSA